MKILGQGHHGVVIIGEPGTVEKFYSTEAEWEKEKNSLAFLAGIQNSGLGATYIIPRLIRSLEGTWDINGKSYSFCNIMQRIPGLPANGGISKQNLESFGEALGELLFGLHSQARSFIDQYKKSVKSEDTLLRHIVDDNAGKVKKVVTEENDKQVKQWVDDAARYLERRLPQLIEEQTLSHLDLNLSNILINKEGSINGLVDWGGFGLTHSSLSLYQLATNPNLWVHIKKQYEASGGIIREDIVYAASTIHLAWAPLICKELGQALGEYETRTRLNEVYANFMSCRE